MRSLEQHIVAAYRHARHQGEWQVADHLLSALETLGAREPPSRQHTVHVGYIDLELTRCKRERNE